MTKEETKITKTETTNANGNNNVSYEAKDIHVLEGLEPVRKRPGMYIGSTGIEGLHHLIWEVFDNSLTYETPVLIEQNNSICLKRIGEIVDEAIETNNQEVDKDGEVEILRKSFNIKSLSFNSNNLKLSWVPVKSLIRHRVNSDIYEITLQNNRKIQITPYHSLFTLQNGEVKPIKGSELQIGSNVVIPKIFAEPEKYLTEINLFDELLNLTPTKTESIILYDVKDLLTDDLKILIKKYCRKLGLEKKETGRTWSNIFYDYKRYNYLPFNIWRSLPAKTRERFTQCTLGNKNKDGFKLKPIILVNKNLVELLGIYAAEGTNLSGKTHRVVFSFGHHETKLQKYVQNLIENVFGYLASSHYSHESADIIQIDSILISLIFREIFKAGENSHKKVIPSIIFNTERQLRERYLIAYLAGDGYPAQEFTQHLIDNTSPALESRSKFSAASASANLIDGFSYLLFSLNKTFSINENNSKRQESNIKINYHGKIRLGKIKNNLYSKRIDFYWQTNSSYINHLPYQDIISQCFNGPTRWAFNQGQTGISSSKITQLLEDRQVILLPRADTFVNSDLGVLKVTLIKKIKYNRPWVYDFSVPNGENFVGGFAPIVCHNSLDEAMAGHAKNIEIHLLPGNRVKVSDDGRGIPVETHHQTKKSTLETVLTTLHAGGKFGGESYKISGGLHGVGVSVVCALSKWMRAEVARNGKLYAQEYVQGKPTTPVKEVGKSTKTGTTMIFEPDKEIFKTIDFDYDRIINHLRQQSYLSENLRIKIDDTRKPQDGETNAYGFYFEGGVISYLKHLNRQQTPIQEDIFYVKKEIDNILVEVAFQYNQESESSELSFANNIFTSEGGTHLTGFRTALTRCLNDYARSEKYLKATDENITGDDVREGLLAIIAIKLREPQFEGQTKSKLGTTEARTAVETVMGQALPEWLELHKLESRKIAEKCLLTQRARKAAKAAKETVLKKGMLEGMVLPGKLADCSNRRAEDSELFLVEGESAGGSCKMGRDRRFQAILPLKGKIMNVEKSKLDKMLASQEIKSLIIALGTGIAAGFNLEKIRYHRVIIATDADVDGSHIRTLLLTLFYRHLPKIIEAGYLYIAQPPLFKITSGKISHYAYNDNEKDKIVSAIKNTKYDIQRYKGLGEMNPEQLWETTMDPQNRSLKQVTVANAVEANNIFDVLMGEEVAPRKSFIQTYAKEVKNLDA